MTSLVLVCSNACATSFSVSLDSSQPPSCSIALAFTIHFPRTISFSETTSSQGKEREARCIRRCSWLVSFLNKSSRESLGKKTNVQNQRLGVLLGHIRKTKSDLSGKFRRQVKSRTAPSKSQNCGAVALSLSAVLAFLRNTRSTERSH
jgi:hypothetical protein